MFKPRLHEGQTKAKAAGNVSRRPLKQDVKSLSRGPRRHTAVNQATRTPVGLTDRFVRHCVDPSLSLSDFYRRNLPRGIN